MHNKLEKIGNACEVLAFSLIALLPVVLAIKMF